MITKTALQALIDQIDTTGSEGTTGQELKNIFEAIKNEMFEYNEVTITSAQILAGGTIQPTLCEVSEEGKYISQCIFTIEGVGGTTNYSKVNADIVVLGTDDDPISPLAFNIINRLGSQQIVCSGIRNNSNDSSYVYLDFRNNDYTNGDFDLLIKVWYKVETKGSNL